MLNIWSDLAVSCCCARLHARGGANIARPEELGWVDGDKSRSRRLALVGAGWVLQKSHVNLFQGQMMGCGVPWPP